MISFVHYPVYNILALSIAIVYNVDMRMKIGLGTIIIILLSFTGLTYYREYKKTVPQPTIIIQRIEQSASPSPTMTTTKSPMPTKSVKKVVLAGEPPTPAPASTPTPIPTLIPKALVAPTPTLTPTPTPTAIPTPIPDQVKSQGKIEVSTEISTPSKTLYNQTTAKKGEGVLFRFTVYDKDGLEVKAPLTITTDYPGLPSSFILNGPGQIHWFNVCDMADVQHNSCNDGGAQQLAGTFHFEFTQEELELEKNVTITVTE